MMTQSRLWAQTCPNPLGIVSASSSTFLVGNPPGNAIDGSLTTRWTAEGSGSWLQLDLGSARMVGGVSIAFFNGDQRQAGLRLATSTDGNSFTVDPPTHVSSGTSLAYERFDLSAPTSARYLRIIGLGNTINRFNSYNEVQICPGINLSPIPRFSITPRQGPAPLGVVLDGNTSSDPDGVIGSWTWTFGDNSMGSGSAAIHTYTLPGNYEVQLEVTDTVGASATTTDFVTVQADLHTRCDLPPTAIIASASDASHPASHASDETASTWWASSSANATLTADLGSAQTVNLLRIAAPAGDTIRYAFDVETSLNGSSWTPLLNHARMTGRNLGIEEFGFIPITARYLRLINAGTVLRIADLQIWVACTPTLVEAPWQIFPGLLELAWSSEPGRSYRLEYKNHVSDPSWTALGTLTATSTRSTLRDATIGARAHRLYRVARLP